MSKPAMMALLTLSLFFPGSVKAQSAKAVMEGVRTTNNTILISTANTRVLISTITYVGGLPAVGMYSSSNVVVGASNACVIFSTGSIACTGPVSGSPASTPWQRIGTNVSLVNSGDAVGIGTGAPGRKLTVSGSNLAGTSDIGIINTNGAGRSWMIGEPETAGNFELYDNTAGAARLTVVPNGQLTINTGQIAAALGINGSITVSTLTTGSYATFNDSVTIQSVNGDTLIQLNSTNSPGISFYARAINENAFIQKSPGAGNGLRFVDNGANNILLQITNTSVAAGGALCINAGRSLSKCTSAIDASGNCTCP